MIRRSPQSHRFLVTALMLWACACGTPAPSPLQRDATNATVTFVVDARDGALDRPVTACLVVSKPNRKPVRNGNDAGTIDGRIEFPIGTRAPAIAARYAALLAQHGWLADQDFVAADNALHFYGIDDLATGSSEPRLRVHAATDSERVPHRTVSPTPR